MVFVYAFSDSQRKIIMFMYAFSDSLPKKTHDVPVCFQGVHLSFLRHIQKDVGVQTRVPRGRGESDTPEDILATCEGTGSMVDHRSSSSSSSSHHQKEPRLTTRHFAFLAFLSLGAAV